MKLFHYIMTNQSEIVGEFISEKDRIVTVRKVVRIIRDPLQGTYVLIPWMLNQLEDEQKLYINVDTISGSATPSKEVISYYEKYFSQKDATDSAEEIELEGEDILGLLSGEVKIH